MKKITAWLSKTLDKLSEYLAERKGLLPLVGTLLVILNLVLVILVPDRGISRTNLFLHLGLHQQLPGILHLLSALRVQGRGKHRRKGDTGPLCLHRCLLIRLLPEIAWPSLYRPGLPALQGA